MNQQAQPRTPRKVVTPPASGDIIEGEYESQTEPMDINSRMLILQQESFMSRAQTTVIDWKKAKDDIQQQADAFPEGMLKCVYNKPVGTLPDRCVSCKEEIKRTRNDIVTKVCPKCKSTNIIPGGMQYAQGLSVYAAETLDAILGFSETTMELEEIDGGKRVRITCTYTDYRSCRRRREEVIVSRWKTGRNGGYLEPEDKFYNLTLKSAASKLKRELILRALPGPIRSWVFDMVQKIADSTASIDQETYNKIVTAFAGEQITTQDLAMLLGKEFSLKALSKADVVTLKTLYQTVRAEDSRAEFYETLAKLRDDGFAADQTDTEVKVEQAKKTAPDQTPDKALTAPDKEKPKSTADALRPKKKADPQPEQTVEPAEPLRQDQFEEPPPETVDPGAFDPVAEAIARENDIFSQIKTADTLRRFKSIQQLIEDDEFLSEEQRVALHAALKENALKGGFKLL